MSEPVFIVCILGATGTGKSEAALALASEFSGCIINFDSRQVYEDFPITTAQPSAEDLALAPHRLYGFLPTDRPMSAGDFVEIARKAVADAKKQGMLPILVGGTGLYLRSLLTGLAPIPEIPPKIRKDVQRLCDEQGAPALHEKLSRVDPEFAAGVHPNDRQRITRGLEVYQATGKPLSWWHGQPPDPVPAYRALKLGIWIDLEDLKPRLAKRIELMLRAGALDEVRAARLKCPDENAPGFTGIGCAELLDVVLGKISLDQAKQVWLKNTRAYAKRQATWFKKEPDIEWFDPGRTDEIISRVRAWLDGQ